MALPGDGLAHGHHLWDGKLCHPGWGQPACPNSISAPALPISGTKASQSACTMLHIHTGTGLLRLFCKHGLKQREQRFFCPSLVYTALSLANVSQTRQVHWSRPDVAPGHPALGWEVTPTSPIPIMTVWGQRTKEAYHQPFSQSPLARVHVSHRALKNSSGGVCGRWGVESLRLQICPSAGWQPVLDKHFTQPQCPD